MVAPSSDVPLVFIAVWRVTGEENSASASSGEANRCVSMSAEKRRRTPDGGLDSLSVKEDSEQERRFLWREERQWKTAELKKARISKGQLSCQYSGG